MAISTSSSFDRVVTSCMHRQPLVAHPDTTISEIARVLHDVATVAIVDELENLVGVVSRTDLTTLGAIAGRRADAAPHPARCAADIMTRGVITVPSTATVKAAAQAMAAHAIHHVYVTEDKLLLGVISALDITRAVREAHVSVALSTIMTSTPIMVTPKTTLGAATELLSRVRISGLVVVEDERPVGTFTHVEALEARDLPRDTLIEALYDPAILCLPANMPLHTAAAQLVRSQSQRVLACTEREVVGIATTLDFVRYVAW